MPTVDPEQIEAFALRVAARHDEIDAYREQLQAAAVDTAPFGGEDAPWAHSLTQTWNTVLGYRLADCEGVAEAIDKIHLNLLHVAAWWFEEDGAVEADFNDTGASLAEHASGEFFQDW